MAVKVDCASGVGLVNSICIGHFDFESILHCEHLDFANKKVAEDVFGQKAVASLLVLARLERLQDHLESLVFLQVRSHISDELGVLQNLSI